MRYLRRTVAVGLAFFLIVLSFPTFAENVLQLRVPPESKAKEHENSSGEESAA